MSDSSSMMNSSTLAAFDRLSQSTTRKSSVAIEAPVRPPSRALTTEEEATALEQTPQVPLPQSATSLATPVVSSTHSMRRRSAASSAAPSTNSSYARFLGLNEASDNDDDSSDR